MTRILAARGGRYSRILSLISLELQVNVSNQNLKAAEAQFQQARAILRYYRADYYPTVTAGPSATRNAGICKQPYYSTLSWRYRPTTILLLPFGRVLPGRRLGTRSKKCGVLP